MPRRKVAHTDTLNWRAEVYQSGGKPSREDIKDYPSAKQMDKMYKLLWDSPAQGATIIDAILGSRPNGKPYKAAWTVPCDAKKGLKDILPNAVGLYFLYEGFAYDFGNEDSYVLGEEDGCPSSLEDLFKKIMSINYINAVSIDDWEVKGKKDSLVISITEIEGDPQEYEAFLKELEADFDAWDRGEDHILDYHNVWYNYAAGEGVKEEDLQNGMARELGYSIDSKSDAGRELTHTIKIKGAIDPAFVGNHFYPKYSFDVSFLKMAIVWGWEKPFELSREAGR